jgi:hypothetical protein
LAGPLGGPTSGLTMGLAHSSDDLCWPQLAKLHCLMGRLPVGVSVCYVPWLFCQTNKQTTLIWISLVFSYRLDVFSIFYTYIHLVLWYMYFMHVFSLCIAWYILLYVWIYFLYVGVQSCIYEHPSEQVKDRQEDAEPSKVDRLPA